MRFVARKYQADTINFGSSRDVVALLLDLGLGKTVITLTIIANDLDQWKTIGVAIFGPPKVVEQVWRQEAKKWDHTKKLKVALVRGTESEREAILNAGGQDIYLISYTDVMWLCQWMVHNKPPFDGVVFDESSMLKDHKTKRFKALKPFMPFFQRRMILTATPAAESLANLWSQYYILDQGKSLGEYITHFMDRHFTQNPYCRFKKKLREGHAKIIYDRVAPITMTLRAKDHIKSQPPIYNRVLIDLPPKLAEKYKEFEQEMLLNLGKETIEAMNPAALSMKCRQFTSGAIYKEVDGVRTSGWNKVHELKMEALEDMINAMDGEPLLVGYEFKHEAERFAKRWGKAPIIGGGAKPAMVTRAFADWNKGKIPLMFVHPQSVGHGVNLQYGGHHLCWYTTTWSGERYQQLNGRIDRQGQKKQVIIHHLVVKGTVDTLVLRGQVRKEASQSDLMSALSAYKKSRLRS